MNTASDLGVGMHLVYPGASRWLQSGAQPTQALTSLLLSIVELPFYYQGIACLLRRNRNSRSRALDTARKTLHEV
jgi:hypothetical protein